MCALRNMKNENNAEKAKKEKAVNQKLLRRKLKVSTCIAQKLHVSRKQGKRSVPRETAVWEKTLGLKQNASGSRGRCRPQDEAPNAGKSHRAKWRWSDVEPSSTARWAAAQ